MTAASSHVINRRTEARGADRKRPAALVALAGVLAFVAQAAFAQAQVKLTKVELQPQPGDQLEVRLVLDGPAPQPVAFTIDNPARLAVDLPNTAVGLDSRRVDVNAGGVDTIVAAEASGRTRVVFNLDSLQPYSTRAAGNVVFVTLGRAQAAAAAAAAAPAASGGTSDAAAGWSIDKVDFRRGEDGAGRILIRTNDSKVQASLKQEGGRIVVDFPRTAVGTDIARRYDVVDFATPVSSFDVSSLPSGARLVVGASGDYETQAYQSDRDYVLEVRPRPKTAALPDPGKKEYKGERLTLNFQDIETRAVLQLLAETSGQNIVVSDSVSGNVTLRLQNVPWDQALDIVLRTKGLDQRREGNVIYVAPAEELAARERAQLESRKAMTELAPIRTEYLQVNYAKASDIAALIKAQGKGSSLLSDRGSVAIDDRTNTLLLQDTSDRLADIRRLVQTLDIPVRQVLIEARIVIVNDDFSRELGVRFGATAVADYGGNGLAYVGNSGLDASDGNGPTIGTGGSGGAGTGSTVQTPPANQRYMVNLPIANPAGRLALTLLDSDYIVDLEISAAQREGRGEIVSAPRVITANGKEASIEQGVEIPYQESASSGATTTQFKKAVLSLKVTPQITPDDRIILDLTVSKDNVGQLVQSATGGQVPSIDTREITTQVLVNDGQTVVLGGIMETEKRDSVNKVPLLGDIPGLGVLFKSKTRTDNKDELLIFVTPKILREGADIY